jgi:tellurium resistance protein TerD
MAISLKKGEKISLSKNAGAAGLAKIHIGLGWDARVTDGKPFDADASAFLLTDTGKVKGDEGFIFYNQKKSACGAVEHQGDNLTGAGDGDDEVIKIDLTKLDPAVKKVAVAVTINEAAERGQSFGQITNAFVRIVNEADGTEIARFDLSEDASTNTAMIFAEVYNHNGEWKMNAVGQGYDGGLAALCGNFGVDVG